MVLGSPALRLKAQALSRLGSDFRPAYTIVPQNSRPLALTWGSGILEVASKKPDINILLPRGSMGSYGILIPVLHRILHYRP